MPTNTPTANPDPREPAPHDSAAADATAAEDAVELDLGALTDDGDTPTGTTPTVGINDWADVLFTAVDIVETRAHLSVWLNRAIDNPEAECTRLEATADQQRPFWTMPPDDADGYPNRERITPPLPAPATGSDAASEPTPPGCLDPVPLRPPGRGRPRKYPAYNGVGIICMQLFLISIGVEPTLANVFDYLWHRLTPAMLRIVGMPNLRDDQRQRLYRANPAAAKLELKRLRRYHEAVLTAIDDTPDVNKQHRQRKSTLTKARINLPAERRAAGPRRLATINKIIAASIDAVTYLDPTWQGWISADETYHPISTDVVYVKQDKPSCATPMAFGTGRVRNIEYANAVGVHIATTASAPYEPKTPTLITGLDVTYAQGEVTTPTLNVIDATQTHFPYKPGSTNTQVAFVGDGAYSHADGLNEGLWERGLEMVSRQRKITETTHTPNYKAAAKEAREKIPKIVTLAKNPATGIIGDDGTDPTKAKQPWEPTGLTQSLGVLFCPAVTAADLLAHPVVELAPNAPGSRQLAQDQRLKYLEAATMVRQGRPKHYTKKKMGRPAKDPAKRITEPMPEGYRITYMCPAHAGRAQCVLVEDSLKYFPDKPLIVDDNKADKLRPHDYPPCQTENTTIILSPKTFKYQFYWMEDSWFFVDAYGPNRSRQEGTNQQLKSTKKHGARMTPGSIKLRSNPALTLVIALHCARLNIARQLQWNKVILGNGGKAPLNNGVHRQARRDELMSRAAAGLPDKPTVSLKKRRRKPVPRLARRA